MNIKCLFGKHDWEEAGCLIEKNAINTLLEPEFRTWVSHTMEVRRKWYGKMPGDHLDTKLSRYICLRKNCCAIKDEVKEFLDYWRQEAIKEVEKKDRANKRNKEAKKKLKDCLEEKG